MTFKKGKGNIIKYSKEDLIEIQQANSNYMRDSFDDWDVWLIELIQKKKWSLVDKELKRRRDLRNN